MAKAIAQFEYRQPPPQPVPLGRKVKAGVTLQLTHEEAAVLAAVLGRIGGHEDRTPRRYTQSVLNALRSAGYYWDSGAASEAVNAMDSRACIYFDAGTISEEPV